MKRIITLFLAFALIIILPSCAPARKQNDKLVIVTTIFPQYDFARAVSIEVQDKVELTMLLPPGSESHDYEPSLADLALIESCDLFICVGGETDAWVDSAIEAVGGKVNVMRLVDHVELLPEAENGILEDSHEHHDHASDEECTEDHEHVHDEPAAFDEHVWTSPENALLLTNAICEAMCKAEPSLSDSFRKGAAEYTVKLDSLGKAFSTLAENAARDTVFFADRFPFLYLTDHMGLDFCASFSGCSSDTEPALSTIYRMKEKLEASDAKVIFTTEFSKSGCAELLAVECSLELLLLHSCHNVSKTDFECGITYAELMEQNLSALTRALS